MCRAATRLGVYKYASDAAIGAATMAELQSNFHLGFEYAGDYIKALNAQKAIDKAGDVGNGAGSVTGTKARMVAKDVIYSDKFSNPKYATQVADRGWNSQKIADAYNNPYKTGKSMNKYTGNAVDIYYINEVHYVALDSVTGKVIQVSDLAKSNWLFDLTR